MTMSLPKQSHASVVSTDDLLDAEPLRLSFLGGGEEINFILGDVADMDLDLDDLFLEEPVIVPTKSDSNSNSIHNVSCASILEEKPTPVKSESFSNSAHNVSCSSIHPVEGLQVQSVTSHLLQGRGGRWSPSVFDDAPKPVSPLKVHNTNSTNRNFDPVPPLPMPAPGLPPRQVSSNSLPALHAPGPRRSRPHRRVTTESPTFDPCMDQDKALYREAVQQLARSMKRTELSRRQLAMMGVPTLRPRPRPVAFDAQHRLRQRVAGGASRTASPTPGAEKSSIMDDFFAGRRSTLTDGLEHSRRQLMLYANRIGSC